MIVVVVVVWPAVGAQTGQLASVVHEVAVAGTGHDRPERVAGLQHVLVSGVIQMVVVVVVVAAHTGDGRVAPASHWRLSGPKGVFELLFDGRDDLAVAKAKQHGHTQALKGRTHCSDDLIVDFPLALGLWPERCQHVMEAEQWDQDESGPNGFPVGV